MKNQDIKYNGLVLFKLKDEAYHHYRLGTNDNIDLTFDEARRKITRNIHLAIVQNKWTSGGVNKVLYCYGSLEILVHDDTVVKIQRRRNPRPDFIFHKRKYEKLSKRLDLV